MDADSGFREGVSLSSPTRKKGGAHSVCGFKGWVAGSSRFRAPEDKVLRQTLILGDTVDTDVFSPQGRSPWAEISGAVQGANNADPR